VTFTVGYAQKENINRAVKKVMLLTCWTIKYFVAPVSVPTEKLNLYMPFHMSIPSWLFCCLCCSFLTILLSCYSTTMVAWANGRNLSGQSEPSMLVSVNKPSGTLLCFNVLTILSIVSVWCVSSSKCLFLHIPLGGMRKDSCTLILWRLTTIYSYGMRTLGWIISTRRSMFPLFTSPVNVS
jgi:hypothetical protein